MYMLVFGCSESSLLHGFSLGVASRGSSPAVVRGLLTVMASLFVEDRLEGMRASAVATSRL